MNAGAERPLVIFDPWPRTRKMLFTEPVWERLEKAVEIVETDAEGRMPAATVDRHIGQASLIIGQTEMTGNRLEKASRLKAVINVEGNFLPNIDYPACFARGIYILAIAPAFAAPVAEMALAMALDLARGVTATDRAFRSGNEQYGLAGNRDAYLLSGSDIGLIGFGNLGRALLPLLCPFRPNIRVYDPWLPDGYLREFGISPAPIDEVLKSSRTVFVLAGATSENQAMLGERELALIEDGASLILMSRAGVVDWKAFTNAASSGRIRVATDVFPEEPVAANDPVRENTGMLLSSHRAGGLTEVFHTIGEMVVDDTLSVLAGLPPVRLQAARPETVGRLRSPPGRSYSKDEIA